VLDNANYDGDIDLFIISKENRVWSKFGIEGVNDFSMFISKIHFKHKHYYNEKTNIVVGNFV
jgi:hypothetical protein